MALFAFVTMFGHGPLIAAHALLGIAVVLLALLAFALPWARRGVLYALAAQIVLGIMTALMTGLTPPIPHALLAVLAGGVYAAANAAERKGRPVAVVRGLLGLGALMLAAVYYIGEHALR